jgi:2-phosphosulfolactate phosphatase
MAGTVVIDSLPESASRYGAGYDVVAIDVIRATTSAVTAAAMGRRCFPVSSVAEALEVAAGLERPLLAGELRGEQPDGFELNNSPAALAERADVERPLVLLSTAGTRLIREAAGAAVYVACLRNWSAQVAHLTARPGPVAVLGAGSGGEFREEDRLCCAWIAAGLIDAGFEPLDDSTGGLVEDWRDAPVDSIRESASAAYLRRSGHLADLEFVLAHVDDLDRVFAREGREVVGVP